ncbi:hypothetical protein Busp01_28760 [Trinickia caryophylli]|nr:hypothetical protein Busp01_28760 [Trinickia caryophylli]
MQATVFDEWPAELHALFDGLSLDRKAGFAASLVVVDECGRPWTSLLSAGELYAPDSRRLAFSLWRTSRAARWLGSAAQHQACAFAALSFVHDAVFYQVQLNVEPLAADGELASFVASIDSAQAQQVGYARLTSGIAFSLEAVSRASVLERWQRQLAALTEAVAACPPQGGAAPTRG